ncbi:MAG: transglutaminase family protein [Hasllibacter sp.]
MRLRIEHVTESRFEVPAGGLIQSQRLVPQDGPGQRVLDWAVTADAEAAWGPEVTDGAGDVHRTMTVPGPLPALGVTAAGTVETEDRGGVLGRRREAVPPGAWTVPTALTAPDAALRELAEGVPATLDGAHALTRAVHAAVAFDPDATGAGTTAAEALGLGRGVCQDHSHVLIAAAHLAGLPARYAVGYLEAGTGTGVSHAWAELFLPDLGWTGFDALNACCPDARYVRLCCGRDAAAAAPIRGAVRGGGTETQSARVAVAQSQQ